MEHLDELKRSKEDHERRMKLTTRFSYLIDKSFETIEEQNNTINLLRELYQNNFELAEKYRDALEEITRQYDNISVNRAKEIAFATLEEDE
jgi:uncharacterized protein (DUF924 family)